MKNQPLSETIRKGASHEPNAQGSYNRQGDNTGNLQNRKAHVDGVEGDQYMGHADASTPEGSAAIEHQDTGRPLLLPHGVSVPGRRLPLWKDLYSERIDNEMPLREDCDDYLMIGEK